jgi:hypothetical protein
MRKLMIGIIGLMLLLSLSAAFVSAEEDHSRDYTDPQDKTDPYMDVKSVTSAVSGNNLSLTIQIFGTIQTTGSYTYYLQAGNNSGYTYADGYSIHCVLNGGSESVLINYLGDTIFLEDTYTITEDTLTFTVPYEYAGPADEFDVRGSAEDGTNPADIVGGEVWASNEEDDGGGGSEPTLTKPQDFKVTRGDKQVTLTWSAPSSDGGSPVTNYVIYKGTTQDDMVVIKEVGNNVFTYTDTGLSENQEYTYRMTAKNANGEGESTGLITLHAKDSGSDDDGDDDSTPGFEAIYLLGAVLVIAYVLKKRKWKKG